MALDGLQKILVLITIDMYISPNGYIVVEFVVGKWPYFENPYIDLSKNAN